MEERIIDDEYGRGIRLKKTADGYVDVTDELVAETADEEPVDEVSFAFPMMDGEDDEDLVSLSPEEALALRKKKEEAAAKRKADYAQACADGEDLLASGNFAAAEKKFEQALQLDEVATLASIGYWRAKTDDFANPDALISEYAKANLENMEYDLGVEATDTIRRDYKGVFEARLAQLKEEEKPLLADIEEKKLRRRTVLSKRLRTNIIVFTALFVPTLTALILTAVFGFKIPTTREDTFVLPTIILGSASFVMLIVTLFSLKKLLNAVRMYSKNERLSASDEGKRVLTIRRYKKVYEQLLAPIPVREKPMTEEEVKQAEEGQQTAAEPATEKAAETDEEKTETENTPAESKEAE